MALIKSISGIRGTIGGDTGNNLTPVDIVKFTAAFGSIISENKMVRLLRPVQGTGLATRSLLVVMAASAGQWYVTLWQAH